MMNIYDGPTWFDQNARALKIITIDIERKMVVFKNDLMEISISIYSMIRNESCWKIEFIIKEFLGVKKNIKRIIFLSDKELAAAFGLEYQSEFNEYTEYEEFDVGIKDKFIRRFVFLNIPNPGNGCLTYPNISIFLNDEVKDPIKRLLTCAGYKIQEPVF